MIRVGNGFDVHKLVEGRQLILGGVTIPYYLGLAGHSDADVLLHAISDALLGALALGDIGQHFPDTDPAFCGISSMLLLSKVMEKLKQEKWTVVNVDSVIVAQKPKVAPYIPDMCSNIARCLEIEAKMVSVKATTTERLGFAGRGEGIAAFATVLIQSFDER